MRVNQLAAAEVDRRLREHGKRGIFLGPAQYLYDRDGSVIPRHFDTGMTGEDVATLFGPLFHYTRADRLRFILDGGLRPGSWLTPLALASCMAPYNLGLAGPIDVCLAISVRNIDWLWGPGLARESSSASAIWRGGSVEFYVSEPVPVADILDIFEVEPCGDA